MTTLDWLDRMVGADRAELWATDRAREYVDRDLLAPDAARRWVLAQADVGDPLVLAGPGQVWHLPDGVDPDDIDAPARALVVWERLDEPARVTVRLIGENGTPGTRDTLLVDVLRDYTLHAWLWWNDLEETGRTDSPAHETAHEHTEETTGRTAPHDGAR